MAKTHIERRAFGHRVRGVVAVIARSAVGRRLLRPVLLAGAIMAALLALTACGGSGKPAYCSSRTSLEKSVKGLKNVDVKNGLSGLKSQLKTIQSRGDSAGQLSEA